MIPSYNVRATADFFRDIFGFMTVRDENGQYIIMYKDDRSIHILRAGEEIGEMEFYLAVDNIDGWWATVANKLEGIKTRSPFDRDYGMREVHIIVPHTKTLVFVGQMIK